jgi:acyl-CoA reductase-like NAD-dependent aldehyde dehydrogenase
VLKPAELAPLGPLRFAELCLEAGVPPGVVNVVTGSADAGAALVDDPRVSKISFTGGGATARRIMEAAARNLTPVVLELGGKDAAIVCRDADLEFAARGIVWNAFMNAGQTCSSVERVYVERPVLEPFLAKVLEEARRVRLKDEAGAGEVGPLTLERQRRVVEAHLADAVARGARVLLGGERPGGPGLFYKPTVVVDVDHGMTLMKEETFGPVLPVMAVDSLDEAIRLANDSDYGLTASGWTRSAQTAERLQRELVAGVVSINDHSSSFAEPQAPWGGMKASGIGRIHGRAGLREMVQPKYVSFDRGRKPALWWYPYDAEYRALVSGVAPALYAKSFARRLAGQLGLMRFSRLWRRFGLGRLAMGLDKLF